MCPINRAYKDADHFCGEPYVMPGNIDGPDSANFGRGQWTWYTGSAGWMFRVCNEWILGIRPEKDGLLEDPCIPKKWDGFKINRQIRGVNFNIVVRNPKHVSKGVQQVKINGRKYNSNVLPIIKGKINYQVEVVLG